MGLVDRLRGRPPKPKMPSDYQAQLRGTGFGSFIAADALSRGRTALHQLQQLPNADLDDQRALVEAVRQILQLSQELTEVDQALAHASGYELSRYLSAAELVSSRYTFYADVRPYTIPYERIDREAVQSGLRHWVEQNVPAPQDGDMLALIERRGGLFDALATAHQGLLRTAKEIGAAQRKLEIINAAQQLDVGAGQDALPELAVSSSQEVERRISAVSDGLNEAYYGALSRRPELTALDAGPAPAEAASPAVEPSGSQLES